MKETKSNKSETNASFNNNNNKHATSSEKHEQVLAITKIRPRRKTFEKANSILHSQMKIPKAFAKKKTLLDQSAEMPTFRLTSVPHQSLMKIGRLYQESDPASKMYPKGFKDASQIQAPKRGRGVKSIEEIELEQGDSDTSFYTSDEEESPSESEEERALKPLPKKRVKQ
ncbi:hypothetical protein C9374_001512 [Naegleria lovaniensis]|uniref:Uncharacterized protein n=1 Tax=Naegleria lovaniensis TaxID=51637 RepID=A0AA88GUK1_NAELO|nr:uncharacterized protein C9374_001512 [Naegleria lovaniensis]KAG2387180.1 hypothetical protein C9374_001512 [Naegleria lovaniensis]